MGRGSRITDAYIGPYSAIGEDVTIDRAELEYSIVLSGSSLRDLESRVEASLIGRNVAIARSPALPRAYRFVVGDNAEKMPPLWNQRMPPAKISFQLKSPGLSCAAASLQRL